MSRNTGVLPAFTPANAEAEALVQSCYLAGQAWWNAGNTKLPRMAAVEHGGRTFKIPVVRSIGDNAHAFVEGWKDAKAGRQAA